LKLLTVALEYTKGKGKSNPYSITEHRVLELIPVLGSQPSGDVSHKPGGRLPLLSASLPKTVTRQRRGCDLNPGPSALESSTLTTRLPSHPEDTVDGKLY